MAIRSPGQCRVSVGTQIPRLGCALSGSRPLCLALVPRNESPHFPDVHPSPEAALTLYVLLINSSLFLEICNRSRLEEGAEAWTGMSMLMP